MAKIVANAVRFMGVHSPCILTAAGLVTMGAMIPTAIKCKGKADRLYIQKQSEKTAAGLDPKLTKKEAMALYAKAYWPVAVEFGVGAGCIIMSDVKMHGRQNALKAALLASQGELANLREEIKAKLDAKDAEALLDAADQHQAEKAIAHNDLETCGMVEDTGKGKQLCCDLWSGRLFYSDIESIRRAFNDLNEQRLRDCAIPVSFNDLYVYLDLETTEGGAYFGWDSIQDIAEGCGPGSNIMPDFISGITEDGRTYLGFRPTVEPIWLME